MGDKEGKWLEHLKAAEASDLTLNGYAKSNQINVQRLYGLCRNNGVRPKRLASLAWQSNCQTVKLISCRQG
jgi:hypothetical protein